MSDWHTTRAGLQMGALAAIAISSCIALLQFSSDAPWKEILEMWWKMLVLTIPAFAATTAVAMLAWRERRAILGARLPTAGEAIVAPGHTYTPPVGTVSLAEAVVQNAWSQATWYYEQGLNPTRRAFEENGVPQTIWASGREILKEASLVGEDRKWAEITWEEAQEVLSKIYPEEDRIWLKPLGKRTMVALHISPRAINKKHTSKEADSEYPNL